MSLINTTGSIGVVLGALTENITGSFFLTVLLIVIGLVVMAMLFRIPLEWTTIFVFPFMLVLMAYDGHYFSIGGVMILYLAVILAKSYFFR